MRQIRTDLAMEAFEAMGRDDFPGVHVSSWETMGVHLTEVLIEEKEAERQLGKPRGSYLTLDCEGLLRGEPDARVAMANLLGEEIARMLKRDGDRPVMVVGLGNRMITPDALGPMTVDRTLVTRHMFREAPQFVDRRMHSVCAIAPGVLGVTGFETAEVVQSLVRAIEPQAVICIDSLAAGAVERIGATIQLTDTGIRPGAGVGNHRRELTRDTLGVNVLAVGMPTVIYAATLARDAMAALSGDDPLNDEELEKAEEALISSPMGEMIVTPREIDTLVADAATVIAAGINRALQPELSDADILEMMQN